MTNRLLPFLATALFFICQITLNCVYSQYKEFSIGVYDTVYSAILKQNRRVLVHVPQGAGTGASAVRYPVLYLLDGENHFTKTVGILDHLSNTAGNELCPQMIVVAIYSVNREADFIPKANTDSSNTDRFPLFLEKELIPYIDQRYPTQPYRTFVGHSLGGLRVINTLVYQPHIFNSYIALDPSLGHVKTWLNAANEHFDKSSYPKRSLYIAMGLTMPKGMDTAVIVRDTSGAARHMRSIMTFAKHATNHKNNGLAFQWEYYPDETHGSVVFKGTYDGLISNFKWYKNEYLYDIFKPEVNAEASVRILTSYYARISAAFGYELAPPEQGTSELIDYLTFKRWYDKAFAFARLNYHNYPSSERAKSQFEAAQWNTKISLSDLYPAKTAKEIYEIGKKESSKKEHVYNISEDAINTFGYMLMQGNHVSDAEVIFRLNVELYPDSYNVYDSYGECLLNLGKEKEGIEAYQKSLELNPQNVNAINILKKYK